MDFETLVITFLIFMTVAVLVAYVASRFRIPYTIAMVLVGLGVSVLHLSQDLHLVVELKPDLILFIFLPGLLFEVSYHIDLTLLRANLRSILLLAIGAVLIARVLVVYGLRLIINRRSLAIPLPWAHVMFWGGMRGAVSITLALSLPLAIQYRNSLMALVFGCVLFSVIVQGLTIQPLLNRLGLTRRSEKQCEFEEALTRVAITQAASDALKRMHREHLLSQPLADRLQKRFGDWIEKRSLHLFHLVAQEPGLAEANVRLMQREISHAQKQVLIRLLRRGIISEEVYADFMADIDELLRDPSTLDWILAAELREGLDSLPPHTAATEE